MDRHRPVALSRELRRLLMLEVRADRVDADGVRPLSYWLEDGWLYCVVEAPSIDAVCKHHAARALACYSIRRIDGLRGTRPSSAEDERLVRAAIEGIWHTRAD
jgi:hypothetical protein